MSVLMVQLPALQTSIVQTQMGVIPAHVCLATQAIHVHLVCMYLSV